MTVCMWRVTLQDGGLTAMVMTDGLEHDKRVPAIFTSEAAHFLMNTLSIKNLESF
jgi:hypothetical protein